MELSREERMMTGARAGSEPIPASGEFVDPTPATPAPASAPATERDHNEGSQRPHENGGAAEIPSKTQFVQVDGSVGGTGYDETSVEYVALSSSPARGFLYTRERGGTGVAKGERKSGRGESN